MQFHYQELIIEAVSQFSFQLLKAPLKHMYVIIKQYLNKNAAVAKLYILRRKFRPASGLYT